MKKISGTIKDIIIVIVILIIIFGSLIVYTGNWPPMVIVESSSMQHGQEFTFGVLNTGDIALVKKVTIVNDIITYVQGRQINYQNYGDYGDVIVYRNINGLTIHRAMFYVSGWIGDVPKIDYFNGSFMKVMGPLVLIENVGPSHRNLVVDLSNYINKEGFVTMGDNNLITYYTNPNYSFGVLGYEVADQNAGICPVLVSLNMIVGKATGYLPWFGDLKLLLTGNTYYVPELSWVYLILTLTAIFAIAFIWDRYSSKKS